MDFYAACEDVYSDNDYILYLLSPYIILKAFLGSTYNVFGEMSIFGRYMLIKAGFNTLIKAYYNLLLLILVRSAKSRQGKESNDLVY